MAATTFVPPAVLSSLEFRDRTGVAKTPNHQAIFEGRRFALAVVNVRASISRTAARKSSLRPKL